jgi:hypothetical protein
MQNKLGHLSGTNALAYLGASTKTEMFFNIDTTCPCYVMFSSFITDEEAISTDKQAK